MRIILCKKEPYRGNMDHYGECQEYWENTLSLQISQFLLL